MRMYNRYIPQPDGSFRRNRMPDQSRPAPQRKPRQEPPRCAPPPQEPCPPPPKPIPPKQEPGRHWQDKSPQGSVGSFLRQLLPKDFDTSDLIVVLLLLLMAGDCPEDQNTALLTLAIYLFL